MYQDEIIAEVWRNRDAYAAKPPPCNKRLRPSSGQISPH